MDAWTVVGAVAAIIAAVAAVIGAVASVRYLRVYLRDRLEAKDREATKEIWTVITHHFGEEVLKKKAEARDLQIGWATEDEVQTWRSQKGWAYFEDLEGRHPVRYRTAAGTVLMCKPARG